jgi:hypothetical protein
MLDGFHYRSRAEIDAHPDPARREIAHRIYEHTAHHVQIPSYINRYLVTPPQFIREVRRETKGDTVAITSEIDTPKGKLTAVTERNAITNTVWTVKYPVETLEDAEAIRSVPWELPERLAPPDPSTLPLDFDERCVLETRISSPFVCAAGMMPYQTFLEWCATELSLMIELTTLCLERILDVLDVLLAEGAIEYVWMGGCEWLTPPMGSPRLYEELVQPFERKVIERIHAAGALCHVHCHGNVRSTLESVIERGGDFFEPVEPPPDGDIIFAEAKALAAGRMALGGNVEARVIANESTEVVEAATRRAFEGGKEHMVLKLSEGPLGRLTPQMAANYHRIVDVWEELADLECSA